MSGRRNMDTSVFFQRTYSRGHESRPFNKSTLQRQQAEIRTVTRGFGPNLQVQGFGCPLQQRPGSGQSTPRQPSFQTTTKPDQPQNSTSLLLLTSLKGKLETRVIPALRSRASTRSELKKGGAPCVSNHPVSETETTPMNQCKRKVQIGSVPELHLYLPSSQCEEEEEEDTQEIWTCAERTSPQESEVKANSPDPLPLPNPSCTSEDQAIPGPSTPPPQCPPSTPS